MTKATRPGKSGKDLSPKSPSKVKGGRIALNDNIMLVRAGV